MTVAIVGAMAIEIEYLLKEINCPEKIEKNGYTFWLGDFSDKKIILTYSGVGKVAAAVLATTLVNLFPDLDLVINIGVAGGIIGKTKIGEVISFNRYAYYDADATYFPKYVRGQIPGCPAYFTPEENFLKVCQGIISHEGMVLSGDAFFTNNAEIKQVIETHFPNENVISLDMESTAFAQSFYHLQTPFGSLRVISDLIGSAVSEYEENLQSCAYLACQSLLTVLGKI